MRAEFYVTQLVRWNSSLRRRIAVVLGLPGANDPESILVELRGPLALKEISRRLKCLPTEIFEVIKGKLVSQLREAPKAQTPNLPIIDVLRGDEFVSLAATALATSQSRAAVYDAFFDREVVVRIVGDAGRADAPIEAVVNRLLAASGVRAVLTEYQALDFAAVLPLLMRDEAVEKLADSLRCEASEIGSRLKALPRNAATPAEPRPTRVEISNDDTPRLDLFGVEKLREMLRPVERLMFREAQDAADEISSNALAPEAARFSAALVEFWGNGAFRKALSKLPVTTATIGRLAREVFEREQVPYAPSLQLTAREQPGTPRIVVEYQKGSGPRRVLAELEIPDPDSRSAVLRSFPISSELLAPSGETLLARLVISPVSSIATSAISIWRFWLTSDPAVAEYFVTAGYTIPDTYGIARALGHGGTRERPKLAPTRLSCPSSDQLISRARSGIGSV